MIAQWENEHISLLSSLWPGFNSRPWRSISRDFFLADHTLPTRPEPAWHKMAQSPLNGTTQPVNIEEEGRSPTMDRQLLKGYIYGYCLQDITDSIYVKAHNLTSCKYFILM